MCDVNFLAFLTKIKLKPGRRKDAQEVEVEVEVEDDVKWIYGIHLFIRTPNS